MSTTINRLSAGAHPDREPVQRKKILIVDDSPVVRILVKMQLEKFGYLVDVAASGEAAIEAATHQRYAVILMDCQMPGMGGYQAALEIRNIEGTLQHTPIIAFTGDNKEGDRQRCFDAGMNDCLAKPATVPAILAALEQWGA